MRLIAFEELVEGLLPFCPKLRDVTGYHRRHRPETKNMLKRSMRKDSLINTNSYLRDSKRRKTLLAKTVTTSTAIEGVHLDWNELEKSLSISNRNIRFNVSPKSSESHR